MFREDAERVAPRRHGRCRGRSYAGVSLVELLVAASVSAVALAGAWPWLWTAGGSAGAAAGRAQAATAAAYAVRSIGDDLSLATSLLRPPAGMSPDRSLCMEHRHDGVAAETVLVAWDPARGVLWRKAAGTYLSDHVELFTVDYFGADGRRLAAEDFAAAAWPRTVALVSVTVVVTVDGRTARAGRTVALAAEAAA